VAASVNDEIDVIEEKKTAMFGRGIVHEQEIENGPANSSSAGTLFYSGKS